MALDLFVDYRAGRLVQSASSPNEYALRPFVQNDNTPIRVTILDADGIGAFGGTYSKRAPSSYSVRVGLFTEGGTQLAYQNTFTADAEGRNYTGNLTANSTNQSTALGSSKFITAYLEIEISSDGGVNYETILPRTRGQTTLEVEQITPSTSSTPPNETAVTTANFAGVLALNIVDGFILRNQTANIKRLVYLNDDGTLQVAPISE